MIGTQIRNYRIVEKLGEGGMGVVYKGIDVLLDRTVAVKALSADLARNPELVERFRAEAKAQANLNHPNLATLYAFLVEDGNALMVMEYVEGKTFDQMIRQQGPIPSAEAIPLFKQALLGIGVAHRAGILHRDLKPSNLMLRQDGIVKVMDFGIAKLLGTRGLTKSGTQLGTVAYMSPEQIQNREVDLRSDIYALGVTLYEMLSGHIPFESDSDFQIMHDHVNTPPPLLTSYYPFVPHEIQNVVLKALEKRPSARFQTAEEFGAALERPQLVPAPSWAAVTSEARSTVLEDAAPGPRTVGPAVVPPIVAPVTMTAGDRGPLLPPTLTSLPAAAASVSTFASKPTMFWVAAGLAVLLVGTGLYLASPALLLVVVMIVLGLSLLGGVAFLVLRPAQQPATPLTGLGVTTMDTERMRPSTLTPPASQSYGSLRVTSGRQSGRTVQLVKAGILIGRSPTCQLVMNDTTVSSEHAWIVPVGGSVVVIDRGSANGTYVNSVDSPRVSKVSIKHGDRIFIGKKGTNVVTYFSS
jgi:serine/threonine protein kinase